MGAACRSRLCATCHWVYGCCTSCAAGDGDDDCALPLDPSGTVGDGQFRVAQSFCAFAAEVDKWNDIHQAVL